MKRIICVTTLLIACFSITAQHQQGGLTFDQRRLLLAPPQGKVDVALDTDTYNEIDDQFALIYAILSNDRINLKGVFAAPYYNKRSQGPGDGMEKSYLEILKIYDLMGLSHAGKAYKGSDSFLFSKDSPIESPAAYRLIELSKNYSKENPLYVLAIGAITNIASAILIKPSIASSIVLVWVAGNSPSWPKATEFNSGQDILSSNVIFDSGLPLILIPARPVTTHLTTTWAELELNLSGKGQLCDYLLSIYEEYQSDRQEPGASKVIWDIAAVAWLNNPRWVPTTIGLSPNITEDHLYRFDSSRHEISYGYFVHRDPVFNDLFEKLTDYEKDGIMLKK